MKVNKLQFTAMRHDGDSEVSGVIMTCNEDSEISSNEEFFKRLRAAVTEWIQNSPDGQKSWENSCQDFNFGDLCIEMNPELSNIMCKHGIVDFEIRQFLHINDNFEYDIIIPDRDALFQKQIQLALEEAERKNEAGMLVNTTIEDFEERNAAHDDSTGDLETVYTIAALYSSTENHPHGDDLILSALQEKYPDHFEE